MHGDAFGELEVGGAQRRAERHAGEVDGHEFGQFARHAGDFDVSGGVRDDGLVHLDGGAFFFAREVQRNAHRDLFVFSDALEVDVQNLRLVRVHLEGAENDEFFLAVEFHRQDRSVELFLAQRVEDGIVFELDGRGGQAGAVDDAGKLVSAAKAAARTRTLRSTRSGDDLHGNVSCSVPAIATNRRRIVKSREAKTSQAKTVPGERFEERTRF